MAGLVAVRVGPYLGRLRRGVRSPLSGQPFGLVPARLRGAQRTRGCAGRFAPAPQPRRLVLRRKRYLLGGERGHGPLRCLRARHRTWLCAPGSADGLAFDLDVGTSSPAYHPLPATLLPGWALTLAALAPRLVASPPVLRGLRRPLRGVVPRRDGRALPGHWGRCSGHSQSAGDRGVAATRQGAANRHHPSSAVDSSRPVLGGQPDGKVPALQRRGASADEVAHLCCCSELRNAPTRNVASCRLGLVPGGGLTLESGSRGPARGRGH